MSIKDIDIFRLTSILLMFISLVSCNQNLTFSEEINLESLTEIQDDSNTDASNVNENDPNSNNNNNQEPVIKYLALGDSYTIGTSVCDTCSYPQQLKAKLKYEFNGNIDLKIIAQTGWTTTALIGAINNENPSQDYDLVTLLIGVNNQYQHRSFEIYETEFPSLLNKAILFAKGNPKNVIVLSIPDYAFTPFGENSNNREKIIEEIDAYNNYAKEVSESFYVKYLEITDITRQGLNDPELVASDGLHPSTKAYEKFVERLLPVCLEILR